MGNKRHHKLKLNLPSSWPVHKRKEKIKVRASWEPAGTVYPPPQLINTA